MGSGNCWAHRDGSGLSPVCRSDLRRAPAGCPTAWGLLRNPQSKASKIRSRRHLSVQERIPDGAFTAFHTSTDFLSKPEHPGQRAASCILRVTSGSALTGRGIPGLFMAVPEYIQYLPEQFAVGAGYFLAEHVEVLTRKIGDLAAGLLHKHLPDSRIPWR